MVGYHYNSIVYFSTQRLEYENYHYGGGKVEGGRGILPYHEKRQSVFGKGKVSKIRITIFAEFSTPPFKKKCIGLKRILYYMGNSSGYFFTPFLR